MSNIFSEMEECKKTIEMPTEEIPVKFRAGFAMAKTDAALKLEKLKQNYKESINSRVATIFLLGSKEAQTEFCTLSKEEGNTVNVSARSIYNEMADFIEPTITNMKTFGTNQLVGLINVSSDISSRVGYKLNNPALYDAVSINSREDLVECCRSLVRKNNGDMFNKVSIEKTITDFAIENKFLDKVIPVVVTDITNEEVANLKPALFSGIGITVNLGDKKIDKQFVIDVFKKLKDQLKTNKK